jgi:DNA-directed RNA polymerase specialized sigma24 family protein
MGYVADQKSQIHSEFGLMMPRLKAFARALTGDEVKMQTLVRAAHHQILSRATRERGHTPLLTWSLMQVYGLWASRMRDTGADEVDPRLFQPRSRANDGGASARFAARLARLTPMQRGALHLVYGERLSYDEVAEIFGVEMSEIITLLARCYALLGDTAAADRAEPRGQASPPQPKQQGRAA